MTEPVPQTSSEVAVSAPLWGRDFILLVVSNLVFFLAFYCLLPTIPKYTEVLGGSASVVGLVGGAFTLSAVAIRMWAGQAIDRGNRRVIYFATVACFILAFAAYRWAGHIMPLLALRVLHGVTWGVLTTATGTFVADLIPAARRGEGMGYFGGSTSLAMIIGPAVGLSVLGHGNYPLLFFTAAAIASLGLWLGLALRIPAGHGQAAAGPEVGWQRIFEVKAFSLSLVMLLVGVVYGGVVFFIALYAERYRLDAVELFFAIFALVLLLFRPVCGRLFDRFGAGPVLPPGLILCAITGVLLYAWPTLPGLLAAAGVLGLGFGAAQPSLQAMIINRVAPQRRGAATATLMSAMDLGIGLGAMALGVIATAYGYRVMYLATAAPAVLALVWFVVGRSQKVEERRQK